MDNKGIIKFCRNNIWLFQMLEHLSALRVKLGVKTLGGIRKQKMFEFEKLAPL